MYDAYKKSVIAYYQSLKINRQLLSELENPSPGKLKRVCVKILRNAPEKRDFETLQDFFNSKNEYENVEKGIDAYDPDKLRPLVKLMKGEIADSINDDNYRLLTVLIGFEPRPYAMDIEVTPPPPEQEAPETDNEGKIIKNDQEKSVDKPLNDTTATHQKRPRSILYSITILMLLISGSTVFFLPMRYMIWRVDRYHLTAQTELVGDTMLVALDKYKLQKFRKIMKIDTVTAYSVGRLWYLKTDNKLELFTTGGKHPVYTERQLKILSQEIYNKYLRKGFDK